MQKVRVQRADTVDAAWSGAWMEQMGRGDYQVMDRENVRKGLACCISVYGCHDCPYSENGKGTDTCQVDNTRDALELLKGNESEWLEDSDFGQEYGTTWACRKCMHSIHKPFIWNPYDSGYKYCPHCGAEMKVKLDD